MTFEEAKQKVAMKNGEATFSRCRLKGTDLQIKVLNEAAELWQQENLERIKELEEREVNMNAELSELDQKYKEFKGAYELYKHKFENSEKRIKELEEAVKELSNIDSIQLIGNPSKRFNELEGKGWDWRSFYNGWLEGRVSYMRQLKELLK